MKMEVAIDEPDRGLARVEDLQAISTHAAGEQHARPKTCKVSAQVHSRLVPLAGSLVLGQRLNRAVNWPIERDLVVRNPQVNGGALRGNHGLPLQRGFAL